MLLLRLAKIKQSIETHDAAIKMLWKIIHSLSHPLQKTDAIGFEISGNEMRIGKLKQVKDFLPPPAMLKDLKRKLKRKRPKKSKANKFDIRRIKLTREEKEIEEAA